MSGTHAVVASRSGGLSRRRFVLGGLALGGTVLAAACQPGGEPAAQTASPVTVEFWIARLETTPEAKVVGEPLQQQALDELNYAKTFPMSPITLDIRVRIQQATKDIVFDGKPAQETLTQARKELDFKWQTDVLPKLK